MLILGVSAVGAADAAENASAPYSKRGSWQETMVATRAALTRSLEEGTSDRPPALGQWYATRPLGAPKFETPHFPLEGIDLDARGPGGKPLWQMRPAYADGAVHNLPPGNSSSTYLFRTITAAQSGKVSASLGSDDGLDLWLNGRKVISRNVARGAAADQDRAELDLKEGENRLLFKIHNFGGGYGFYFSLGEKKTAPADESVDMIARDFPQESAWMRRDLGRTIFRAGQSAWLMSPGSTSLDNSMISGALSRTGDAGAYLRRELDLLLSELARPDDRRWLDLYLDACRLREGLEALDRVDFTSLRLAVEDLAHTFPERYAKGAEYVARLRDWEARLPELKAALGRGDDRAIEEMNQLAKVGREALLENPLIDFDRLLVVKRGARKLGLPQNWQGNCAVSRTGYDNGITVLSPVRPGGSLSTLYKPDGGRFVGDVDLHFDADRMIFSSIGSHGRWQIFEMNADGTGLRQVTPGEYPDVDNYDPCYLPNGKIVFGSTRCFHGVPCVGGANTVANLHLMDADGKNIRQICFDQDHDWSPSVKNDGRVLYTRWEYSDTPHYFTRLLFHMNPDGTSQMEYYGSNSLWPNSTFYARAIPGHSSKVVGIVSGHHGVPRMGELVIFDPAKGRHEASGVVQRIPGRGKKVKPRIADKLVDGSWPKFLHPYPLSENYFLVSAKPLPDSLWGIYLVDVFDNMVLLAEEPGYALFEPVPLRKTLKPPVIPDRVDLKRDDATVYMADVYSGSGMKGVPRGAVKKLRVYEYHYTYPGMGGHINIGIDGPWDVRRIHGTVPVNEDGSAIFRVPANMPLGIQPLDEKGRSLQVMRSWFVAGPGESISCVGCHEKQNTGPPARLTTASRQRPVEIEPWYGPPRGFSFKREVQPVLDQYCVGCHDGGARDGKPDASASDVGPTLRVGRLPDLRAKDRNGARNFTQSYLALHPYVRRPGPESDYHIQKIMEWHASTSELVQMLEKGHHGVKLDREAWDRLNTWIDLNVPDHGTWGEHRKINGNFRERRRECRTKYANRPEDPEEYPTPPPAKREFVKPDPEPASGPGDITCPGWPFDEAKAQESQESADAPKELKVDLGGGQVFELVLVPAGEFVMGDADGFPDERPLSRVKVSEPFYMGRFEVTNAQYALFDPGHDSAYISWFNKDQGNRGAPSNRPGQPVIRISWERAMAFCEWLSKETGREFTLPTEAQWEWACRAGTRAPLNYGGCEVDFGKLANLADSRVSGLTRRDSPKWIPRIDRVNDGAIVSNQVGRYPANIWGLRDMHGNVCEWTRTLYRPYPYREDDGRNDLPTRSVGPTSDANASGRADGRRVARGGSWYDRPRRARSAFRLAYERWQPVYNVGFRVVCPARR